VEAHIQFKVFPPFTCPLPATVRPRTTGFVGDLWRTADLLFLPIFYSTDSLASLGKNF